MNGEADVPGSAAASGSAAIAVIGEALVDLVPGDGPGAFVAHPGGSPYNVAIGLARLDQPTVLFARLASNSFGQLLRAHASASGVDLRYAPLASEPTTLAVVSLDPSGQASYDFYVEGTADWQWSAIELATLAEVASVVHFGSLASWTTPGDVVVLDAVRLAAAAGLLVSYDPNVRPSLLSSAGAARVQIEACIGVSHVVKASSDDVTWLYPGVSLPEVARGWLDLGAALVVLTAGGDGADVFVSSAHWHAAGRPVEVVDTVGAGDAFMAGLLAGLVRRGVTSPRSLAAADRSVLGAAVDDAILVSALTCERAGADPPRLDEIDVAR